MAIKYLIATKYLTAMNILVYIQNFKETQYLSNDKYFMSFMLYIQKS